MTSKYRLFIAITFLLCSFGTISAQEKDQRFLSYITDPSRIQLYWKDDTGEIFGSLQNLKSFIETRDQELAFAMNGGMYTRDSSPQGLYMERGKILMPLDTLSGAGNFYLKPNGVFYLTKNGRAVVCETSKFVNDDQITYATQSGPMLIIDGKIHPAFKEGSKNVNIRNGVGILPDNKVVFVISKEAVNFYEFAEYFKNLNCKNALYLDGFVSRAYLPEENWIQLDGNFGVLIGVIK